MKYPKFTRSFEVIAHLPESLAPLKEIASNFRWTWDHASRDLFRAIDKARWDASEHNPVLFVNQLPKERIEQLAHDAAFLERMNECAQALRDYLAKPTWFDRQHPELRARNTIAYFCFEFGLTEGLPIYSGGLGVLAGDHLKAASDLGLPLVGVGLLYNRGYFRQRLTLDGWQQEVYPEYDFYQMPLTLMRTGGGDPIRIDVAFPDRTVTCQIWRADVGRIPLYLLDSNVLENAPADQGITDSLYSGDEEMRIRQEMILGIGGMRALEAVGIKPTVCHMNEGHAAFLSLERIRQFMAEHHCDFRVARHAIVGSNVFTTHTPVPAGFDLFRPDMLERYLGPTVEKAELPFDQFLRLGRVEPENQGEAFNMAVLAMETANHVNGVSQLHAKVSRSMFSRRWPDYPDDEVPVRGITNGIHTMTWVSRRMAALFDSYLGTDWRRHPQEPKVWEAVDEIPDEELWFAIESGRADLVRYVRKRLQTRQGRPDATFDVSVLDSRVLTIGFARRFATYKRGSLMLTDRERLKRLLFHADRPVQIIIAGKAHPRDDGGKHIIQDLWNFIHTEGARARMVFLEDYDMKIARALVQGVDVWLNNPRRPYEASGTSGMKVVPNGGLNCSILDGWWDEGYDPTVGFAIGDRTQSEDSGHQDWLDSRSLYHLLENEIGPTFYHRSENGLPVRWLAMVKASIRKLAPYFSTARMVRDYAEEFYVPAMHAYERRALQGLDNARDALAWRDRVQAGWQSVRVVDIRDTAGTAQQVGDQFEVTAVVELGPLHPEDVSVQAVIGKVGPNRDLMATRVQDLEFVASESGRFTFRGCADADVLGHQGYTVRIVPRHADIRVPEEFQLVSWPTRP
ncbi:MAG: alpha-glucan family phosphorylase [Fimbriimonadaceae bacterium]|nr:alpha-glucan family phosphorylase [Fimbriimonadaceae bacterium]